MFGHGEAGVGELEFAGEVFDLAPHRDELGFFGEEGVGLATTQVFSSHQNSSRPVPRLVSIAGWARWAWGSRWARVG